MLSSLRKLWGFGARGENSKRHTFQHIPAPIMPGRAIKSSEDPFRPRRGSDEDRGTSLYHRHGLMEPPYSFADCWVDYEQSDVLTSCVDAIIRNCERPHDLEFVGDDLTERDTPEMKAQCLTLTDFFSRVNEKHSFLSVRRKLRLDREVTGNGFLEVIRSLTGGVERVYYLPSTYVRASDMGEHEIPVTTRIPRDGKLVEVTIPKKFRRFGRLVGMGSSHVQWYKELGDPRVLDPETGEFFLDQHKRFLCEDRRIIDSETGLYVKGRGGEFLLHNRAIPLERRATEVWWFRDNYGGNAYGIPRWIPALLDVRARYVAKWLNHDLLNRGGVPKGIVLFQNGSISPQTLEHIRRTLQEWGDPRRFNQWITLNIEPDSLSFDLNTGGSKGGTTKPEFINLDRNEDYMFKEYLTHCEEAVRKVYRLPPILTGAATEYTHATAYASQEAAESQVFEPLRNEFDEKVTTELIQTEFGIYRWKLKTRRTKIGDQETFYKAVGMWSRAGLSWNQMVQLGNEMLGTRFSPREGELWDMPFEALLAMLNSGGCTIRDGVLVPMDETVSCQDSAA